jgi:ABC-type transport system involved in multi-copper enzyme maturation permease subunit
MASWGLTVIISLVIALFSMLALIYLRGRDRKSYSNCFWKGFLVAFVLTALAFAALARTGCVEIPLILGLPVGLAVGSLAGLILEIIRNKKCN